MVRINNIDIPLEFDFNNLKQFIISKYKLNSKQINDIKLSKKSVDARKKNNVHFVISVDIHTYNEQIILKKVKNSVHIEKYNYEIKRIQNVVKHPVIVGFGPAGIFAGLVLAQSGARPIILERGGNVDERQAAVDDFWKTGKLDDECNVQFGEGGAASSGR